MRALVVLDGDPLGSDAWLADIAKGADVVIAADGGATRLGKAGRRPDLVMRFGYGPTLPFSARRPVESTMIL